MIDSPTPENDERPPPTVRLTAVTGADTVTTADPTEDYHEASRLYPGIVDPLVVGAARLERSHELRLSVTRSVKRHAHLPFVQLPPGALGSVSLGEALARRRSRREYGEAPLDVGQLATLLAAAYGVTGTLAGTPQPVRTAPSGGALYPLELYAACPRVSGLDAGLYHYDPYRHGLELIRPLGPPEETAALSPYDELVVQAAAVVAVTGMFWRSRFKYGARAYRFTLLEAGHVGQCFLLAAAALGLATTPVGGFYDRRVDEFLGIDGIHEAALYLLPVGTRA